ncbi:MAG TPA: hypothetical protein VMX57_07605, partial [Planctomycetota bacterium]|nr:hypothetical protein [Planctomycetota bacterium]
MEIRAIRSGEERKAAALVYELTRGTVPDEQSLGAFLDRASALETDLTRQVVAVTPDGSIVGTSIYFPQGDGSATVVTPLCAAGYETPEVQQALLRALGDKARADGVHMLQVFTSQDDARTHELLAQCGFEPLAVLLFMSRPV